LEKNGDGVFKKRAMLLNKDEQCSVIELSRSVYYEKRGSDER